MLPPIHKICKAGTNYDFVADISPCVTCPDFRYMRTVRMHLWEENKDTYWLLQLFICPDLNKVYIISSSGCSFEMVASGGAMSGDFYDEYLNETIEIYMDDPTEDHLAWSCICNNIITSEILPNYEFEACSLPTIISYQSTGIMANDIHTFASNIQKQCCLLSLPPINLVPDVVPTIASFMKPSWLINPDVALSYIIDFKAMIDDRALPWTLFSDM